MGCVPAGDFIRGSNDSWKDERPQQTIWLDAFYMDKYEVTYADYKACEAAKVCRHGGPNYRHFDEPTMPITGANWYGADEFCKWKGKRLPTEAEWEKAARGTDGRKYPWGNEVATCERAIIDEGTEHGSKENGCKRAKPWPVGSRPPTLYGLYDMAGNVHEWVADWYTPSYKKCGDACSGKNPKGPCGGSAADCPGYEEKVVRGGSWFWDATWATTTKRRSHVPSNHPIFHHFGFRCAKDASASASAAAPAETPSPKSTPTPKEAPTPTPAPKEAPTQKEAPKTP
jgi:formylglycine-generating enzyme required for sulfatase activity